MLRQKILNCKNYNEELNLNENVDRNLRTEMFQWAVKI